MERIAKNELEKRVDEVLFYVWDPIGVRQDPYARAEYRTYVVSVLGHVKYKNAQEISEYLCSIIVNRMSLTPDKEKALEAAELMLLHKEAIDEGCA